MPRKHLVVIVGVIVAMNAATACGGRKPPAPLTLDQIPIEQGRAVVSPKHAHFVINVEKLPTWRWNQPTIPERTREYGLVVELLAATEDGKSYQFGYSHVKAPGAVAGEGSLADLLALGELKVWEVDALGAKAMKWGKISALPMGDSAVVLVIKDEDTIKRVFETRPSAATIVAAAPGQFERRYPAEITYLDR